MQVGRGWIDPFGYVMTKFVVGLIVIGIYTSLTAASATETSGIGETGAEFADVYAPTNVQAA
jgi:hypothetical protein